MEEFHFKTSRPDLLSVVHYGVKVVWQVQSVPLFHLEVVLSPFNQKCNQMICCVLRPCSLKYRVWLCELMGKGQGHDAEYESCLLVVLTRYYILPLHCDVLVPVVAGVFVM